MSGPEFRMPRLTLRAKLMLFTVVIAIVPLLIAGQTLIRIARDELKSSVNDQLVTTARQVSEEIDDIFEFAWVAPLLLIRNAIDAPNLSVQDKISLLTRGIADLDSVVALQITVSGSKLPLVVTRDGYATKLMGENVEPLTVLRTPVETIEAAAATEAERIVRVDRVPATRLWLATVILPLDEPLGGGKATFSARIDLSRLQHIVGDNPFQRTGSITVVDAEGRSILGGDPVDLTDFAIVSQAISLLSAETPIVTAERYVRPDETPMLAAIAFPRPFEWAVVVEKSEHDAYFAIGKMIESLAVWVSVGLVVAIAGAVLFAIGISRPILAIGEAAIEVAKGNFRARVDGVRSRDEIGDLARRFNTMIVQLNERFHLEKFVSSGTMAAIQKSDHEGVKLGGERREAAILFADIRGYTAFAESRDPETVVDVLNYYFQQQADIVAAHNGDIDKFVGDQIMAVFQGVDMARDAAACAVDIQDVMVSLGKEHADWELDIGIGIDMGWVVMGAMGAKQRMDYTVLGDHVNLAARLCSAAAPRQTLISDRVANPLRDNGGFALEALEPIRVKGKSEMIEIYSIGRGDAASANDNAASEPGQVATATDEPIRKGPAL